MHYSKRIERSAEKRAFIMKKKLLSVVLTAVMAATVLTGCGSTDNGTASTTAGSAAQTEAVASTDGKVYNIGICQLVEHEALDAATQGFQDALKDKLGDNVKFDLQNAQGLKADRKAAKKIREVVENGKMVSGYYMMAPLSNGNNRFILFSNPSKSKGTVIYIEGDLSPEDIMKLCYSRR